MIQINNYPRYFVTENGQVWDSIKKRFLHQFVRNKRMGYLAVNLYIDGKCKMESVHRLVAKAYLPNPCNYPMVNHKDENTQNNHKDNLEWCDAKYNNSYGTRKEKVRRKEINRKDCSKVVLQLDKDGTILARFPSAIEVERQLHIRNSQICGVCNHRKSYHTAGGYVWKWKEEVNDGEQSANQCIHCEDGTDCHEASEEA